MIDRIDQILTVVTRMAAVGREPVQFADLEEFANELQPGDIVRIQSMQHQESSAGNGMVSLVTFGVACRAFTASSQLIAWFMPVARHQMFNSLYEENQEREDRAWGECDLKRENVAAYLVERGADVRPGIIYLDPHKLVYGGWRRPIINGKVAK